jgi:hypothetical protein
MITTEKARDTKATETLSRLSQQADESTMKSRLSLLADETSTKLKLSPLADETKSGKVKTPKAEKTPKPKEVKNLHECKGTSITECPTHHQASQGLNHRDSVMHEHTYA